MDTKDYKLIRGERILQTLEMLEEAAITDLERNIVKGFPQTKKRQYATDGINITQMKLTPYESTTDLLADGTAQSHGHTYEPKVLFLDVEYEDEDTDQNVTFTSSGGKTFNIQPLSLSKGNVKVKCTCLDFHYRFSPWNDNEESLFGNPPPPYQRKTNTRPPANPMKVSGLCKHILKAVQNLRDSGLVKA